MPKLENLRAELVTVSSVIENHKEVAEKAKISVAYLTQIRSGKNATVDCLDNRNFLKELISIYRRIGRRKEKELQQVLKSA